MGFSITPKLNGMESHVVTQMRTIYLGVLESSWSIGSNSTIKPSSAENRACNPRVQLNKMLLQKRFVGIRKRQSAAIESEEKKMQIKHERREHALAKISATIKLDKKEAILSKLKVDEDMEDLDPPPSTLK
jgi:hypothetical protein